MADTEQALDRRMLVIMSDVNIRELSIINSADRMILTYPNLSGCSDSDIVTSADGIT